MPTVPCPGCARPYDADRLAGGRTLVCACGARVGVRAETGIGRAGEPRFLCDAMLAGLARRLRALGHATALAAPDEPDDALVRRAREEGRLLLTRDAGLAERWWTDAVLLLASDAPGAQLREVDRRVPLRREGWFTRCTRCDEPLETASAAEVEARVPARVRVERERFLRCPSCARIYWEGGHVARMRGRLREALGEG